MSDTSGIGLAGQRGLSDDTSRFNMTWFLVQQALGLVRTATLVQVKACSNTDAVAPVGTVDVMPLVNLTDGLGNATKHGIVYGLPYFRLQGGHNAVIIDPEVGDIGIAVFADRDISSVKAAKAQSNPGSRRRFNWADGMYIGGVLNAAPTQYIRFSSSGVVLYDKFGNTIVTDTHGISVTDKNSNTIVMDSSGVKINGVLFDRSQNISNVKNINGSGEVTFNSHTLTAHTHTQPNDSNGDTEQPTNTPTG